MRSAVHRLSLVMVFGVLAAILAAPVTTAAQQQQAPATEDIVHMMDGRVLNGQILSETNSAIEFEYRDRAINASVKLTLLKTQIAKIERDVPLAKQNQSAQDDSAPANPSSPGAAPSKMSEAELRERYGIRRLQTEDPNVPSIYIVPMRGQLGTDVNAVVYEEIVRDIREKKPDVVVLEINCEDINETMAAVLGDVDRQEMGYLDFEESNKLVSLFHNELRGVRQVAWIHNAVGMSSVVSLSWREVYMRPSARLAGMMMVLIQSGAKSWTDPDVRAKMMAAWTGQAKSFLERGGHAHELGMAMMDPEYFLSASWEGRKVRWMLDDSGEFLVDTNDEYPTNFNAKMAEDLCISSGTAQDLDDLALLLGFREYRVVNGVAEDAVNKYITDWRRLLEQAKEEWDNYRKYLSWAGGEDARQYLGRAKSSLEKILAAMKRYKAVEIRLMRERGLTRTYIEIEIERLREQIGGLSSGNRGGGGRGGGGSGMGGGGRGGGGGGNP